MANPALGFDVVTAGAIYGLYTSMVYLLALPGGWVADQLWGQRKAVFVGGCVIAAGHFSMAVPTQFTFFLGLALIAVGTGLLKPNVSSVVADLYPEGGARRDAGFSIFYMGINVGALAGPFVCSWVGEGYNWHLGFSLAGIGMVAGLIQFRLGYRNLGRAGILRTQKSDAEVARTGRTFFGACTAILVALVAFGLLVDNGTIPLSLADIAEHMTYGILGIMGVYFLYVLFLGGHTADERKKVVVIFWLFLLAALFWSGFEQAGSSLNIFARDYTDRTVGSWEYPASLLQSVNAFFIIVLAPVFGWFWVWLANRNANPSVPMKFALGLLGLAAGFFVIAWGAANATSATPVSASWLVVMYFLHTVGELALSPVGLSAMTKLAPRSRVSQMMGVWFVAAALGNLIAGRVAGRLQGLDPSPLFMSVAMIVGAGGLLAVVVSPLMKRLAGDEK